MNKTWNLIKVTLKMQYSSVGKSNSEKYGVYILLIFLIPFAFIIFSVANTIIQEMYQVLSPSGNESLILGVTFLSLSFILFLVSIGSILSSFYFSEDIESFIPYPFQPYQLMVAKAATPFIHLYITTAIFFLPILLFYGAISHAFFLYYLYGLLLFLLIPVIPFILSALIVMFFMRFANISKNKDRTKVFAGLLSLLFIIGINVAIRLNQDPGQLAEMLTGALQQQNGLLETLTKFIPTAFVGTMALADHDTVKGLLYLLGMIVLSGLGILLFLTMGQTLYFKGVLGLNEGNKSTKNKSISRTKVVSHHVWITYVLKELKIIFRTPTFLLQCVIQSLFAPVFLVVILLLENSASLGELLANFEGKYVILILFLVTLFILGVNPTSTSAISKDGTDWYLNLYYPISMKQIITSKIIAAWMINLLSILLILLASLFLINIPTTILIMWLLLALEVNWFTSLVGTYLDFLKPKLKWTDEQEVFKSRMISLKVLMFEVGIFGTIVLLLWNIPIIQGLWVTTILLFLLLAIAIFTIHYLLNKKIAEKHYQQI
ncbi:putative ABC transporter permease subunit [Aquibacillus saliphilus]|uniref:putative ABC transporter permease subunit n=1 Tax=Aquibacillus saliphilus TaxID=1909422 RepID=UPI001CEFCCDB|nr:ABC transporter permease [Aquibacillus saliphilus]